MKVSSMDSGTTFAFLVPLQLFLAYQVMELATKQRQLRDSPQLFLQLFNTRMQQIWGGTEQTQQQTFSSPQPILKQDDWSLLGSQQQPQETLSSILQLTHQDENIRSHSTRVKHSTQPPIRDESVDVWWCPEDSTKCIEFEFRKDEVNVIANEQLSQRQTIDSVVKPVLYDTRQPPQPPQKSYYKDPNPNDHFQSDTVQRENSIGECALLNKNCLDNPPSEYRPTHEHPSYFGQGQHFVNAPKEFRPSYSEAFKPQVIEPS